FTTNAVDVNVVANDVRDIDRHLTVRECSEADLTAAIDHLDRVVEGARRCGAFEHVVNTLAAVQIFHGLHHVIHLADIDDVIGTQLLADLQAIVARAGQNDGLRAKGLSNSDAEESDWSGTGHHDAFTRNESAELRKAV